MSKRWRRIVRGFWPGFCGAIKPVEKTERDSFQEIVLINQFAQYVEIWQRNEEEPENPREWHYRHYGPGEIIDLASMHARIEMAKVYRGVTFDEGETEE